MLNLPENPYPETITDEVSGVEVPNDLWRAWQEGQNATLKAVIKWLGEIIEGWREMLKEV